MSNPYTIPNNITSFDGSGVPNTDTITAVNFESGSQCTTIDDYAFQNWTSLVSIDFSNANITIIKNYSFSNCLSLQEIVIPNTVTFIGDFSFVLNHSVSSDKLINLSKFLVANSSSEK